eukprot:scaffold250543_cov27-Tisochrysis_lutea.AAC.1
MRNDDICRRGLNVQAGKRTRRPSPRFLCPVAQRCHVYIDALRQATKSPSWNAMKTVPRGMV